jgi:hypothetical protein
MSIEFQNFIKAGFREASRVFSESDEPKFVEFGDKRAEIVNGTLRASREMKNAGMQTNFDESCVLILEEFQSLGATFNDVVKIGGRMLEIKDIEYASPLVVLMLKAPR